MPREFSTVTDPGQFSGNPFTTASAIVNSLANPDSGFVTQQILKNRNLVDPAVAGNPYNLAIGTIDSLKDITFEIPNIDILPVIDPAIPFDPSRPIFIRTDFGTIEDFVVPPPPTVGDLPTVVAPNIPTFQASIDGLSIPSAPIRNEITSPGLPPAAPVLVFPVLEPITFPLEPQLAEITTPEFAGVTIPTFDPQFPTVNDPIIGTLIDWQEPVYTEVIINESIAKIRDMLAGGLAIDIAVEQGIVDRSRDREDKLIKQAVSQAVEEMASRGYSSPPGVLVERIDNIREEGLLKKLGLSREVMIKIFDEELANMRLAVQQGIAAEEVFVRLHLAAVERLFEVKRLDLTSQIELYNLQVTVFNARMREVEIRATVFETQVRAALAEVDIFKALIDAERVKAETNKVLIDAFVAQIEARKVFVDIFEAQVRATGIRAEIYAVEIQAFRSKVEAYAAEIGAEKLKFDAFEAQVRGEAAKATIIESEARAYAAEIEGLSSGVTAEVAALRGEVSKIEAVIQTYLAELQGNIAGADIQLKRIQADVTGFSADTQKFIADGGIIESENRVVVAAWDAANRTNIAFFEAQVSKFRTQIEALTQQARVALGALSASGDIASTITAGSLAAMHLGATVNGGANVSANGSESIGFSESVGQSDSTACSTSNSSSGSWTSDSEIVVGCPT